MDTHLTGQVALVTGSARRIGQAIARKLHSHGMRIVLHYHQSIKQASCLVEELNQNRPKSAVGFEADLSASEAPEALVNFTNAHFGRLDLLVNNASIYRPGALATLSREQWDSLIDINLTGPIFLLKAASPLLRLGRGSVVNLLDSRIARYPSGYCGYLAAKSALETLTRALAKELAPEVRVNAVSPGAILWPDSGATPDFQDRVISRIPLGRLGEPGDVANAVAYLASESYLTGVVLPVDGGAALN